MDHNEDCFNCGQLTVIMLGLELDAGALECLLEVDALGGGERTARFDRVAHREHTLKQLNATTTTQIEASQTVIHQEYQSVSMSLTSTTSRKSNLLMINKKTLCTGCINRVPGCRSARAGGSAG